MLARFPIFAFLALSIGMACPVHAQTHDPDAASETPSANATRNENMLRQFGLRPDTSQYQIGDRWLNRFFSDPDVQRSFEISRAAQKAAPDKPAPGFMEGLARATPQDRYDYYALITGLMERSSLDQCADASVTDVRTWVAASRLSDAETDTLFRVMFDARKALGQDLPRPQTTPQQVQAARSAMGAELNREYPSGTPLRTRYRNAALHPDQASPSDVCFVAQTSLHLILELDATSRDVMLLGQMGDADN